jgi:hypothetical protein
MVQALSSEAASKDASDYQRLVSDRALAGQELEMWEVVLW